MGYQDILRFALAIVLVSVLSKNLASAQCPINSMVSFERIGGVTVKDESLLTQLFSASNITDQSSHLLRDQHQVGSVPLSPITAECNNRCRRNSRCRGFLVDYSQHACFAVEASTSGGSGLASLPNLGLPIVSLVPTKERTAYFEKACFNLPSTLQLCERAWMFERVLAHQLVDQDDKIIDDVSSRFKCQEYCMKETTFKCRSGEYDYLRQQCRLSKADRHTKPKSFRPASSNVDYFENQCLPTSQTCDAFDRFDNMDLGLAEILRPANSSEQCQQLCTQVIKAFVCRSFTWSPLNSKCYLNSQNTHTSGGLDSLIPAPGLTLYQRNDCIDLNLECDHTAMKLHLRTNEEFKGRMYVRDEPHGCDLLERSGLSSSLVIPFQAGARCAQREQSNRYSSVVVVQQHPLIQRKSDRYIRLVCDFQSANRTISSTYNVVANPWTSTALINATSVAPQIRLRITDKFNKDIASAKLGDELHLNIEAESDSVYDMVARSVVATSTQSGETITLIDHDGCPTDARIFPTLKKINRRLIRGKFDAFKFSSDVVVRFQVDVQFCLSQCLPTACDPVTGPIIQSLNADQASAGSSAASTASFGGGDTYRAGFIMPSSFHPGQAAGNHLQTHNHLNHHLQQQQHPSFGSRPFGSDLLAANYSSRSTLSPSSPSVYMQPNGVGPIGSQFQQFGNQEQQGGSGRIPSISEPANQPALSGGSGSSSQSLPSSIPDPQTFEARSSGSNSGRSSLNHDRLDDEAIAGGAAKRRRRRSAEPLPAAPTHIPLQQEIMIVESVPLDRDEPTPELAPNSIPYQSPSKKRLRNARKKMAYDFEDKLDFEGQQQGTGSTSGTINNSQTDSSPSGRLICTSRHWLVFGSFAFCGIQMLSLTVCLLFWLQRRSDSIRSSSISKGII